MLSGSFSRGDREARERDERFMAKHWCSQARTCIQPPPWEILVQACAASTSSSAGRGVDVLDRSHGHLSGVGLAVELARYLSVGLDVYVSPSCGSGAHAGGCAVVVAERSVPRPAWVRSVSPRWISNRVGHSFPVTHSV